MPDITIAAFRDHGRVRLTLEEGVDEAHRTFERLAQAGVDIPAVMQQLQDDGVRLFAESFDKLMKALAEKREALLAPAGSARGNPVPADTARRLWDRDPTLWKDDAGIGEKIRNRLGWLASPVQMRAEAAALRQFADEVRKAGLKHAVLLGMGGSSLCPEVCRNTYGVAPGYLDLRVLDTTDPAAIAACERAVDLRRTLFINASKSGTTIESASLARYFWEKAPRGEQFVAITDPGTALDQEGQNRGFRRVFRNPADIGGRYSALSYFGLVPAALIGADVGALLDRAEQMIKACGPAVPVAKNPGVTLGAALGELAAKGRDKVTFVLSPRIADFGNWVEQLLAESTGKEGKGLVPVVGEPFGGPEVYGNDRVFIAMLLEDDTEIGIDAKLEALEHAGHPVFRLPLKNALELGGEFFRWEVATAVCGMEMKINPFDEPNVTESKDNTSRLLKQFEEQGRLPDEPSVTPQGVPRLLEQAQPGDYIALLAFLDPQPEYASRLQSIRANLRDATRLATTLGFGPRYLHSTGQLHKGGPNKGLFLLLTADNAQDLPIPGQRYTFGILKQAQALGDLESLKRRGRRVLRLHLGRDIGAGLDELAHALAATARAAR